MLVSVVIPAYNRERYIGETLRSVLAQTYRPLELIVVDNCSSDATPAISQAFAETERSDAFSVKVLRCERRGASACRNTGAQAASGEWIYFFDSDDVMSPTFIADAVNAVEPDTQVVAAATCIDDGRRLRRRVFRYRNAVDEQILTGQLSTQAMFLRAEFLAGIGGWNETLPRWNDWELGVRVLLARPVISWLRPQAYHRIRAHAESITGTSFSGSCAALLAACRAAEGEMRHARPACTKGIRALALRASMLAGLMRREGYPAAAREMRTYAATFATSPYERALCRTIEFYTAHGGRGAWFLASLLV